MRSSRPRRLWGGLLSLLGLIAAIGLLAPVAPASHPDETGKGGQQHWDPSVEPGEPGPEPPTSARASGVEVIGHADPGGFNGDVVAHRRHAYMGSWGNAGGEPGEFCPSQGVRVFSLADPSSPAHVATFADAASEPDLVGTWTEKVIVDSYQGRDIAAVSIQNCMAGEDIHRGWGLWDVTNPSNPQRLALVYTDPRDNGSHEIWLERRGNSLYVYTAVILSELSTSDNGPGVPDFQIWDVSDPTDPEQVGEWGAWAELGIHPASGFGASAANFVHSVIGAVAGNPNRAYLSYWDLGTVILDVSDPSDPRFLGRTEFSPGEEGNAHSAWLARGGRILIQADEDFAPAGPEGFEDAWGYARIFDISDPSRPEPLSTFEMPSTRQLPPPGPGFFTVHDPKVRGADLYLSYYAEGVVVVDISDPANPSKIAQFVPEPAADPFGFFFPGEEYPNVWGVDLERNYAVVSDINSGLWVFKLDRRSQR